LTEQTAGFAFVVRQYEEVTAVESEVLEAHERLVAAFREGRDAA